MLYHYTLLYISYTWWFGSKDPTTITILINRSLLFWQLTPFILIHFTSKQLGLCTYTTDSGRKENPWLRHWISTTACCTKAGCRWCNHVLFQFVLINESLSDCALMFKQVYACNVTSQQKGRTKFKVHTGDNRSVNETWCGDIFVCWINLNCLLLIWQPVF